MPRDILECFLGTISENDWHFFDLEAVFAELNFISIWKA